MRIHEIEAIDIALRKIKIKAEWVQAHSDEDVANVFSNIYENHLSMYSDWKDEILALYPSIGLGLEYKFISQGGKIEKFDVRFYKYYTEKHLVNDFGVLETYQDNCFVKSEQVNFMKAPFNVVFSKRTDVVKKSFDNLEEALSWRVGGAYSRSINGTVIDFGHVSIAKLGYNPTRETNYKGAMEYLSRSE